MDANITMRLRGELQRDDWAALVMHYEGLDWLAHQGGIKSYVGIFCRDESVLLFSRSCPFR